MGYYMQVSALETQKSIYFQTNPSPPPSCCIQVNIWPVISLSVEETCGHLMTPTGVMHAIAQDGAMTVSFNMSLYILCEMRGTLRRFGLFTGHWRLSLKQHTWTVAMVQHKSHLKQPPVPFFVLYIWFSINRMISVMFLWHFTGTFIYGTCALLVQGIKKPLLWLYYNFILWNIKTYIFSLFSTSIFLDY